MFARPLLAWYDAHGRRELPWQTDPDLWRVWVSEIMLQQTQVRTVIPYFKCFIARFPDVASLATATLDEVLHLWSGLGYYARARNLKRGAECVMREHDGEIPQDFDRLNRLPGIGRSTAGAILSFACAQRHPILDGNVKRVLSRYFAVPGWPGTRSVEKRLWELAESCTPQCRCGAYNQAIMDLGATLCRRRPQCAVCPLENHCQAAQRGEQSRYPAGRPRRALAVKQGCFLILENSGGAVFLERRPPTGIWGGLWCLPECPAGQDAQAWVRRKLGFKTKSGVSPAAFRHSFSHYHLDIQPLRLLITGRESVARECPPHCWYAAADGQGLGLPAPIKAVLNARIKGEG